MSSENVELRISTNARSSRKRWLAAGFVVLLFLIPLVRFLWITSHTVTGWEIISRQWHEVTVRQCVEEQRPVYSGLNSADRVAFWLRETQRIVAEEPDSAELAMGAAILLDSPGLDFVECHGPRARSLGLAPDSKLSPAVANSEDRCREECLAMAAKATKLQPKERRWWRLRALLLFDCQPYLRRKTAARLPDWLDVLQECREHDPGNALYDYLVAWQYWRESVDTTVAPHAHC